MKENILYGDQGSRESYFDEYERTRDEMMQEVEMIKGWSQGRWLDFPNDDIWSYDVFIVFIKNNDDPNSDWEVYPAELDPTKD